MPKIQVLDPPEMWTMYATVIFGYSLIALSAALLAQHWQAWRYSSETAYAERAFHRLQLQRRTVASALIGVVGAAISLADRVPPTPRMVTAYLFGLVIGVSLIFLFALADWRATRRRREHEALELVARKLLEAKTQAERAISSKTRSPS